MQIKTKKQIDIELDKSDLLEAVRDLLAKHGQSVSDEELDLIKFINSPQTGLRAELKITEESGVEPEPPVSIKVDTKTNTVTGYGITTLEKKITAEEPEPVQPSTYDDEEPGVIAASTVEDVLPSVSEIKAMIEENEAAPVTAIPPEGRTKLFM